MFELLLDRAVEKGHLAKWHLNATDDEYIATTANGEMLHIPVAHLGAFVTGIFVGEMGAFANV